VPRVRGKGLTQNSLGDTVGSSVPGPHILLPSLTPDIWEKVGRKDGTGSHPRGLDVATAAQSHLELNSDSS